MYFLLLMFHLFSIKNHPLINCIIWAVHNLTVYRCTIIWRVLFLVLVLSTFVELVYCKITYLVIIKMCLVSAGLEWWCVIKFEVYTWFTFRNFELVKFHSCNTSVVITMHFAKCMLFACYNFFCHLLLRVFYVLD